MITLISGTNRPNSLTFKFSKIYFRLLKEQIADVKFFSLENLPDEILHTDVYEKGKKPPSILKFQNEIFLPSEKFIFIFPEYNGSYPGILKLFIDVMDAKTVFTGKKAALIGISTGRAGNLRGIDQLAAILLHMNVRVMPHLLPVSKVQFEMDNDSFSEMTHAAVTKQIENFRIF